MIAVALVEPRRLETVQRDRPQPGPGEVRIAVSYVGICGTDLEFYRGRRTAPLPFILGHEASGRVDAVGAGVEPGWIGARVTLRPNFGCGGCPTCLEGRDNLCTHSRGLGVTIDGCLAEYVLVPERYVWRVPDEMDLKLACLVEPVAVAERAVRRAGAIAGRQVCVVGAGPIGLAAARIATLEGGVVTTVEPEPSRRTRAESLGVTQAVASISAVENKADVVIETAGVSSVVSQIVERARPGGRIVLTGIPMDAALVETRWIVWRELEVLGSFIYEARDFGRALARVLDGSVPAREWVTHTFAIAEASRAFSIAEAREGLKVLIEVRREES
ncbi:MAG: alcohol dehydrogenase catalytic domain-containing protein [Candidatus Bipolaricaulota bacterium]